MLHLDLASVLDYSDFNISHGIWWRVGGWSYFGIALDTIGFGYWTRGYDEDAKCYIWWRVGGPVVSDGLDISLSRP